MVSKSASEMETSEGWAVRLRFRWPERFRYDRSRGTVFIIGDQNRGAHPGTREQVRGAQPASAAGALWARPGQAVQPPRTRRTPGGARRPGGPSLGELFPGGLLPWGAAPALLASPPAYPQRGLGATGAAVTCDRARPSRRQTSDVIGTAL